MLRAAGIETWRDLAGLVGTIAALLVIVGGVALGMVLVAELAGVL
jgi:hypothetical protein